VRRVVLELVAEACRPPKDVGVPVTHGSATLLGEHVRREGFLLWFNAQDKAPFNWTYRPKSWGPS
jgi:hypothetical protein